MLVESNGTVSKATFSCAIGYDMIGEAEIACGVNGTWSNEYPSCGKTLLSLELFPQLHSNI